MAHNEILFPLTVSRWMAAPRWNTTVTVGKSGNESRNAEWQDFLWTFNAGFAIRTLADIDTLLGFFNVVRGRETSFLVKNWAGYDVTDWTAFDETLTGNSQTFQLFYEFSDGTNTYHKPITKLQSYSQNNSAVAIVYDRTGSPTTPTAIDPSGTPTAETEFEWDSTTGLVTYDPPGSSQALEFKINGEFYIPCRFDVDELPMDMINQWVQGGADTALVEVPDIPFIEVRT